MTVRRLPVVKGIKTMLAAVSDKPVFIGRLPKDQEKIPAPPYAIIYPLDTGHFGGDMDDAASDAWLAFQVTSIGLDGTGAEWMADKVRGGFLDRADGDYVHAIDAGAGQKVMTRRPAAGAGGEGPSDGMVAVAEQFIVAVTRSS